MAHKTITWTETDNWHNAYIGEKCVGSFYKSIENENRYYWVSGSQNGFESTPIEAMKAIEKVINY